MTGRYTDIVEIVAPDSATEGERVDVTVRVRNIDPVYDHLVACVAIYDGSAHFIDEATLIRAGETYSFSGSFTMPNRDITIDAFSYYPEYKEWIVDDRKSKDVSLAELFAGTISRKELEYDGRSARIPVY